MHACCHMCKVEFVLGFLCCCLYRKCYFAPTNFVVIDLAWVLGKFCHLFGLNVAGLVGDGYPTVIWLADGDGDGRGTAPVVVNGDGNKFVARGWFWLSNNQRLVSPLSS